MCVWGGGHFYIKINDKDSAIRERMSNAQRTEKAVRRRFRVHMTSTESLGIAFTLHGFVT